MKNIKKTTSYLIVALLCCLNSLSASTTETPFTVPTRFGVNLSCGEFGTNPGTYNSNYTYPRISELDYFKSKGFTLIRMPFKWERVQDVLGGPIDTALDVQKIKEFLQAAQDRGIYVMLDMHNYARCSVNGKSYLIGQTENVTINHFADVWTKLANELKGFTNIWGYDIMNEPHDMGTVSWFKIAQAVIDGIRTVDTNTPIVVEGGSWASSYNWKSSSDSLKYLVDPSNKIIYQAHCYFDNNASGVYSGTYDTEVKTSTIDTIRLKPFADWLETNNKIGMIGEFGVPDNDPRWLTMLDQAMDYMKSRNMSGTYWAAGPWWGSYPLSVEPTNIDTNPVDRPQMAILSKYNNDKLSALKEIKTNVAVKFFPNPVIDILSIVSDKAIKNIVIYNLLGEKILDMNLSDYSSSYSVSVKDLPKGNYIAAVIYKDETSNIARFIKG